MTDNPDVANGLPNVHQLAMIRVVLTGYVNQGRFAYQIETVNTRLSVPYYGFDADPLNDARNKLYELSAANIGALIGLFQPGAVDWTEWTTLGPGVLVRGIRPLLIPDAMLDRATGRLAVPIGEPPAKSAAPQSLRSKSPELPIGTGRVRSGLDKPVLPHRKPRRAGSGGRRGQR